MRGHRAHVALTLIAAAIAASAGSAPAWAQSVTSPYIEPNPNVTVDLSVLDGIGGSAPAPGPYAAPAYPAPAYTAPGGATGVGTGVPGFLVRPDAPRYAAPPPEVQALIQGRSGSAPAPAMAAAPPAPKPAPPRASAPQPSSQSNAPAPMQVEPAAPARTTAAAPPPPSTSPSRSAAGAAPAVPPPPSVPEPSRTASVASPPPPPAVPRTETAQPTSAPAAPAVAATSGSASTPAPAPSSQSAGGDTTRIAFPGGQSQLPDDAAAKLDPVIARLKQDDRLRVQLMAYADGDQDGANKARRLSLSRALAVRAYLIDNEIASTRMDVRALGNRADDGPADRVDLVVINR